MRHVRLQYAHGLRNKGRNTAHGELRGRLVSPTWRRGFHAALAGGHACLEFSANGQSTILPSAVCLQGSMLVMHRASLHMTSKHAYPSAPHMLMRQLYVMPEATPASSSLPAVTQPVSSCRRPHVQASCIEVYRILQPCLPSHAYRML